MSTTALVTGASGFVGQHLCQELRRQGMKSVALTRPNSSSNEADERCEIDDVFDVTALRRAIAQVNPNFIFHLAGSAIQPNLDGMYRANTLFGASICSALEPLDTTPPPVLIVAGSAAEYGPTVSNPRAVTEDTACHPTAPYGIAKLAQTHHTLAAQGCQPIVARLFNPIGPKMPAHLALGSFAARIALIENAGVLETGMLDVERDFFDVEDAGGLRTNRQYLLGRPYQPARLDGAIDCCLRQDHPHSGGQQQGQCHPWLKDVRRQPKPPRRPWYRASRRWH
jgi:nucleoside-diphosphate-sugar epimerase